MKIGLLGRILIAIALGVALGHIFTLPWVRIFVTFNSIFGQFLGFIIPLIILGLVTPAIADIGKGAGKLLLITVGIAYADTVIAAILSYTTGTTFFPRLSEMVRRHSTLWKSRPRYYLISPSISLPR